MGAGPSAALARPALAAAPAALGGERKRCLALLPPAWPLPPATPFAVQRRFKRKTTKKSRTRLPITAAAFYIRPKRQRTAWRLVDLAGTFERPFKAAHNLKRLIHDRVTSFRRHKDFALRNRHRISRVVGDVKMRGSRSTPDAIVTPLTQLQHAAKLPRHAHDAVVDFEHTLSYSVVWTPPTTRRLPEDVSCSVEVPFAPLHLTARQITALKQVLGPGQATVEAFKLSADLFPDRNHNAAYLGDLLKRVVAEVKQV